MRHRDLHRIVACGYGVLRQTIALRAHDDGKFFTFFELRAVEAYRIVVKSHGRGLES